MIKSKLLLHSLDGACDAEAEGSITGEEIYRKHGTGRIEDDSLWLVDAHSPKPAGDLTGLILTLGEELNILRALTIA